MWSLGPREGSRVAAVWRDSINVCFSTLANFFLFEQSHSTARSLTDLKLSRNTGNRAAISSLSLPESVTLLPTTSEFLGLLGQCVGSKMTDRSQGVVQELQP